MKKRFLASIGVALWSIGFGSVAARAAEPIADLDQFIRKAQVEFGVPGVAVAVVQDDRVLLLKGYGVRQLGEPGTVDENTIFQLASNSKTFTAAGMLYLKKRLNAPVIGTAAPAASWLEQLDAVLG